jgi:proteasome alpha subunit
MYNEFENLRKAGVRYADFNGYIYDKSDVTALGLANAYAQTLGTIFTESNKPYEVEIVVAEVGANLERDQIYRITFVGSVTDERGYVAMGGQADRLSAALQERYSADLTLAGALGVALEALAGQGNGEQADDISAAAQLEVALLDRTGEHRRFRRLTGPRLEALLAEARPGTAAAAEPAKPAGSGKGGGSGKRAGSADAAPGDPASPDEAGAEGTDAGD